ncbi:MAG: hypothetical protein HQK96_18945 [Nitrospirae bacterium]|nr:hypothetical protein [Nitrospirota bacterium]
MKPKVNKELWLLNNTGSDVSVSDLGVKVPAGGTINVYKYNPYITEDQVNNSIKCGALSKRLSGQNPVLKIVPKKAPDLKTQIRKIQQSNEPIKAVKTHSSIVIEQKNTEEVTDDKGFDFADYGIDASIAAPTKDNVGGVTIKAKEDVVEEVPVQKPEPAKTGSDPWAR